ncbi:MAG: hypothetical protein K6F15_08840 [Treponema sp.]|nr:hypothetical protein [Treponema sp.]
MGVQPIDLQTMYSQISNVAKQVSHVEQGVQLAKSMQQADVVKTNTEQSKKVQQTGEDSKSAGVNQNGRNGASLQHKKSNNKDSQENPDEEKENSDKYRLKEDFLGQHIDITR